MVFHMCLDNAVKKRFQSKFLVTSRLTPVAMMTPAPPPPPASGSSPYFNPAGMMPPMQGGVGYNPQEVVDPNTQYQQPNIMTPQPAMQQPQLPPAMMEPAAPVQQQTIQQVWSLIPKAVKLYFEILMLKF